MVKKTAAKPAAEKAAGEVTKLPAPTAGDTGAESAPPVADNPPVTEAVTGQLDGAPHGDTGTRLEVIEGAGGVVTADPDSEIEGQQAVRISGWVIECKRRDRGLWRAGRFWPPEPTAVPADDLTDEQLTALLAEPLLSVVGVE